MVIAAYSFYQQDESIFLLLAFAAILVWIIPSFILRAHFNKQNKMSDNAFLSAEENS